MCMALSIYVYKKCTQCGCTMDLDMFPKSSKIACGFKSQCKICRREWQRMNQKKKIINNSIDGFIVCTGLCGCKKPSSAFRKSAKTKSGYVSICIECANNKIYGEIVPHGFKKCAGPCNKVKSFDLFRNTSIGRDGKSSICKKCFSLKEKEIRIAWDLFRRAHLTDIKICSRCSQPKMLSEFGSSISLCNKCVFEYGQEQYYSKHDKRLEQSKMWRSKNADKIKQNNRKRRAMKQQVREIFTVEDEAFISDVFNHECFNCGTNTNLGIDHVRPLSKGNALTRKNACVLCNPCNASKGNREPEDFYDALKLSELFGIIGRNQ